MISSILVKPSKTSSIYGLNSSALFEEPSIKCLIYANFLNLLFL